MGLLPEELVRKIHDAPSQFVLALNGGSRAVAEMLEVPGGSRTLLEATVPYSESALVAWLGSRPEQFCAARTARAMAVVAFGHALRHGAAEAAAAGIASSASLASDRPKRGPHRAHVALQTAARTACWSLELQKAARSRAGRGAHRQPAWCSTPWPTLAALPNGWNCHCFRRNTWTCGKSRRRQAGRTCFSAERRRSALRSTGFSRNPQEPPKGGTTHRLRRDCSAHRLKAELQRSRKSIFPGPSIRCTPGIAAWRRWPRKCWGSRSSDGNFHPQRRQAGRWTTWRSNSGWRSFRRNRKSGSPVRPHSRKSRDCSRSDVRRGRRYIAADRRPAILRQRPRTYRAGHRTADGDRLSLPGLRPRSRERTSCVFPASSCRELRGLCSEVPADVFREDVSSTGLRAMQDE